MKCNQTAIKYIQKQLEDFDAGFVQCVIRCFSMIEHYEEPDGCMSNSAALFVCAKHYGYEPELCYGLCSYQGIYFYHAWLEINGVVIDPSIYGNVNFTPDAWNEKMDLPYIGSYDASPIHYGRFVFDEDWPDAAMYPVTRMTLEQYINNAPGNCMWVLIGLYLDKTISANFKDHLTSLIKKEKTCHD